jgi:zinc finger protein
MPSKGKKFIFELKSSQDLDRQIVKSDHALIYVPQLELEIPSETQQGTLSTVEGVLRKVVRDLDAKQKQRVLVGDLENFHRCRDVIRALEALIFSRDRQTDCFENQESEADSNVLRYPFEFILDDPSGLSMIENPFAPQTDESLKEIYYQRSSEQNIALGLQPIEQQTNRSEEMIRHAIKSTPSNQVLQIEVDIVPNDTEESGQTTPKASQQIGRDEALKFPTQCPSCHAHTETAMCIIDIPHFQQVIIMSLNCEKCGFKSNEIKPSGKDPSLKL